MRNTSIREEEKDAQTSGTTPGEDTAKVPAPDAAAEEQQEEQEAAPGGEEAAA